MSNNWTREDFPRESALADLIREALNEGIYESGKTLLPGSRLRAILDMLADWMNAHHPKPDGELSDVVRKGCRQKRRAIEAERQRDDAHTAYEKAARERDAAVERAEQAEAALERVTFEPDPIVYVVRESDIAAVEVHLDEHDHWIADGRGTAMKRHSAEQVREDVKSSLRCAIESEAVARAIEAEQAVDPIAELAREEAERRYSGTPNHAFVEGALWATNKTKETDQ